MLSSGRSFTPEIRESKVGVLPYSDSDQLGRGCLDCCVEKDPEAKCGLGLSHPWERML